ncbi:MAG TPA: helix-turn-helix domain-containing protein [Bryobacteraceae bacterium]|nr:helix-turn-helix domain-containing protein [Bryobacteraceae bacterium]
MPASLEEELAITKRKLELSQGVIAALSAEIAELRKEPERPYPTLKQIADAVCRFYDVTYHDLVSVRRTFECLRPRHVAFYLARTLTPMSFPQMGRGLGGRDHTTCLHAFRKIAALRKTDEALDRELIELERVLKA